METQLLQTSRQKDHFRTVAKIASLTGRGPVASDGLFTIFPFTTIVEASLDLTQRIKADFTFDPKATSVSTPLRQVLARRRGVCQDYAHFMIGCLRTLGLAARYVSGYILTRPGTTYTSAQTVTITASASDNVGVANDNRNNSPRGAPRREIKNNSSLGPKNPATI
jgi:hypothetical protein